jgi:phosphate transport system protein
MSAMAQKMLRDSLAAYINLDIALAENVCAADDEVDDIYHQTFRELLTYMMEDPRNITQATQLLFVARYLERVADHATNIGEWVIYLETGQRMRKK